MPKVDTLRDSWASLGVSFSIEFEKAYTPEEALCLLVQSKEFPEDKKMLSLALTWLSKYSKFVHVERLQNLAKDLAPEEIAVLGAISAKCLIFGDHRWKKIEKMALKVTRKKTFSFNGDSKLLLQIKGQDKEFQRFNILVAPIQLESDKKFYSTKKIIQNNPWLKFRLLFGSNLRADVATILYLQLASTAYAAAKYLNASTSAVYRNWQDLKEADWDEISSKIKS